MGNTIQHRVNWSNRTGIPLTRYFAFHRNSTGAWSSGNPDSYYKLGEPCDDMTFTTCNGGVVGKMRYDGSLASSCFFHGQVITNREHRKYPGGWTNWDRTVRPLPRLRVTMDGETIDLPGNHSVSTAYLAHAVPIAAYDATDMDIEVIVCAPIGSDGIERPRGLLICLIFTICRDMNPNISVSFDGVSSGLSCVHLPSCGETTNGVRTSVVPMWIHEESDLTSVSDIQRKEPITWVIETCEYWQRVIGNLSLTNDEFAAELFVRCSVTSLQSGVLNERGEAYGVLYGVSSFNGLDNFRDCFYYISPAFRRDPVYAKRFIAWFAHYSINPGTSQYPKTFAHSLGNSVNGVVLAGMYYEYTGDVSFFRDHPDLVTRIHEILDSIQQLRDCKDPMLFPSEYISDGYSLGDYHTGSNICVWKAFTAWSTICAAIGDERRATAYHRIATEVRIALEEHNRRDDGHGPRYVEGVLRSGRVPVSIHDGEESDTTLMPYYGYCGPDDDAYLGTMRFAVSTGNVAYSPETMGIVWESYGAMTDIQPAGKDVWSEATFPGYITALAGCRDVHALWGSRGYLTEIRRLTDHNGALWWWPYRKDARRGADLQRWPFECGWAEGTYAMVFERNLLGISYDASSRTLCVEPCHAVGDYSWTNFPIGLDRFTVTYKRGVVTVVNHSSRPVMCDLPGVEQQMVHVGRCVTSVVRSE